MTWSRHTDDAGRFLAYDGTTLREATFAGFVSISRYGRTAICKSEHAGTWALIMAVEPPTDADLRWLTHTSESP